MSTVPKATAPPAAEPARPAAVARAREAIAQARGLADTASAAKRAERERDVLLVNQARQGDAKAFRTLVEKHQGRLFAVAFGMLRDRDEAMDAVQDAFIKAHRKLTEFEGNAAFSTWLYRICVNLCIDRKRADTRRRKVDLDDALATHRDDDTLYAEGEIGGKLSGSNPLRNSTSKELGQELGRALAGLSEEHRSILLLREVEGMSYEEIAETLSIPKGTVMSRLFHARRNMQRELRPFLGLDDTDGLDGRPQASGRGDAGADPGHKRAPATEDSSTKPRPS